MDVAVKGLFWLLEACRESPAFRQFILVGGDAGIGPFLLPPPGPGDRDPAAQRLPGLLRAVQGAGGGDDRAVRHPVRPERLLPAGAVGDGQRTTSGTSCRSGRTSSAARGGATWSGARAGRRLRGQRRCPGHAGRGGPAAQAELRARRRPGQRHPGRHRPSGGAAADLQHLPWTSRSTTATWVPTWRGRGACPPSASGPAITPPGSTTPRPSSCSAGGRVMTWRGMTDEALDYQRAPDDPRLVWYPG